MLVLGTKVGQNASIAGWNASKNVGTLDNAKPSKHNNEHEQVIRRTARTDPLLPLRGELSSRHLPDARLLERCGAQADCGRWRGMRGVS
jgi:hypothetical protein